jgi:hypothetical protein
MSMRDFVKKAAKQSKESINRSYRDIDDVYYQIDMLNNMMNRYMNKKSGASLTVKGRQNEISDIREMIADAYKSINFYKECINAEKKEMKRIYDTYGYPPNRYSEEYNDDKDNEYDESDDFSYGDEINEDCLEEIKEYKYNFATGIFE